MNDSGAFWTIVAFLVGCGVGAWAGIRESANAVIHGGRNWWKLAMHSADWRVQHRQFKRELEEVDELERHAKQ